MKIESQKAQILVLDVLFLALVVVFIVYLEMVLLEGFVNHNLKTQKDIKELENLLYVDRLITDCNYLAFSYLNHESLCYQNVLDVSKISTIDRKKICKIGLSGKTLFDSLKETDSVIVRGVVVDGSFETLEFFKCK